MRAAGKVVNAFGQLVDGDRGRRRLGFGHILRDGDFHCRIQLHISNGQIENRMLAFYANYVRRELGAAECL